MERELFDIIRKLAGWNGVLFIGERYDMRTQAHRMPDLFPKPVDLAIRKVAGIKAVASKDYNDIFCKGDPVSDMARKRRAWRNSVNVQIRAVAKVRELLQQ